ncbi:MAG TPA: choice-of-anchor B family protein [Nocardioidaceae bacterium]|nr:choice-of-anchor B family protein [Nocardioidaceae bacterium]
MTIRLFATSAATAGLASLAAVLVFSGLPALAHPGDHDGEGKDEVGEVDPNFPTDPLMGEGGGAGAPCEDGQAGYFPCENVGLASFLPMSAIGGGRGSDVWGWTDPLTERRYAIAGRDNGTAFVDVTNERRPVYLGNLPTSGTNNVIWRDIKVHDDHAYVVAEAREHGMQVFDLTQLRDVDPKAAPVTFEETARYTDFGRAHNVAINEDTGFAYAVGVREDTRECAGGLHMIDLRDPAAPVFAGCFADDGYTHDTQCVEYDGPDTRFTGREICFSSNEDTLTIVDVTDKQDPVQLARVGYDGSAYSHQGWLTEDGRHFLMGDELDELTSGGGTSTLVWDVEDLTAPVQFSRFTNDTTAIDHNLFVKGDLVFQSNYRSGLRILDASEVADGTLREVGYLDTWPEDDDTAFSHGTWSNYPFLDNGLVLVHGYDGLFLARPTGAAAR